MGDLDYKPFYNVCKERFSDEEAQVQASTLCSLWQDNLTKTDWHPFKIITVDGNAQVYLFYTVKSFVSKVIQ